MIEEFFQQLLSDIQHSTWLERIAVVTGIASVWFSRIENVLVYPVGLINTCIYIYISIANHLPGEAAVNLYYTIMSFYGWFMWMRKDVRNESILHVTFSNRKMIVNQILFFLFFYISIYFSLVYLKENFFSGAIPWADAFASATAFTGMWLMARKKVESWYWWIATNIASIPLYHAKGLALTSVYYFILLILAFLGVAEWRRRASIQHSS